MALVPVDTPLALFEIHRIARKIPVDQAVAPGMEIEPFLTKRQIERLVKLSSGTSTRDRLGFAFAPTTVAILGCAVERWDLTAADASEDACPLVPNWPQSPRVVARRSKQT